MADPQMFDVGHDLIEAYIGYYEDEWMEELRSEIGDKPITDEEVKLWMENRAIQEIVNNLPLARLKIYLEWNGIIGYAGRIYELAIGHF